MRGRSFDTRPLARALLRMREESVLIPTDTPALSRGGEGGAETGGREDDGPTPCLKRLSLIHPPHADHDIPRHIAGEPHDGT